jgi:hypothetical protein
VLLSGVVHQAVEAPKLVYSLLHYFAAMGFVADVAWEQDALTTLCFYLLLRLGGIAMLVEVRDGYVGSLFGEGYRDCAPDTAVTSCDEGHLASELARAFIFLFLRFGLWGHL